MRLWHFLKEHMQCHLRQEVCENGTSATYGELIAFAESFAARLTGFRSCAVLCGSEMAASAALLSCFAAGVTAVPLSARYGEAHCQKILDTVSPDALITDTGGELRVTRLCGFGYREPLCRPALIMCTSGTTGTPKGAMLTESNVMTNVADIAAYFRLSADDRLLIARPLYHCAVLTGEWLTALVQGAGIRFYSGEYHPAFVLKLLKEHGITAFGGTPTWLSAMARFRRNGEGDSLRYIVVSGECLSAKTGLRIADAFKNAAIFHVYGLTEAGPRVAYLPPALFSGNADCVGVPLRSVSLRILADDGSPVKTGETGTLWVKGGNVMAGYYNDPDKTAEVIRDGWLCTGDLARFTEKGLLKILGRRDGLIIRAGMNIYPQEIEAALKADARVRELYVRGKKDAHDRTQIVLHIAGAFADTAEVRAMCRARLPAFQVPNEICLTDELPKNGSGKIIRR